MGEQPLYRLVVDRTRRLHLIHIHHQLIKGAFYRVPPPSRRPESSADCRPPRSLVTESVSAARTPSAAVRRYAPSRPHQRHRAIAIEDADN
jgi:hypothetical protein